ncbi:hypothetical protein M408DRAFT_331565 [Serendipita vermifera MAFF 305830]|uniref:Uncharacterized protein n=1 Tax=Serendipita vermifera MAFF 305830 TaxID=933852 RepID=A0A0C2X6H8_SERVB|nr:hypothetical protein M408DRAFT_331565 [Serendipita vermifera MAFF 305830]
MGKKKAANPSASNAANTTISSANDVKRGVKGDPDPAPLGQYLSMVGTHTLFLLFCIVFMPRSTFFFMEMPHQASSQDRPQAEWMAPITVLPSWSVAWMCAGAAAVQMSWARKIRTWILEDEGNAEAKAEEAKRGMKDTWRACGATLLGAGVFHVVIVILGAPFATHIQHTFLLALLISILSIYAPARCLTYPPLFGSQSDNPQKDAVLRAKWSRIFVHFSPKTRAERALFHPAILVVFGAWCGAYPLALDWDRPWQAWPLTPAVGAILGHVLGDLNSVLVSTVYYLGRTLEDPRIKRC